MTELQKAETIERDPRRIRVLFGDHEVADSDDVLVVSEPGAAPVLYFPRRDVEMLVLGQTHHQTVSATKGRAVYFTIYRDGHIAENAAWSFEAPPPPFQAIAGHIAFRPGHFEFSADGDATADCDLAAMNGLTPLAEIAG